MNAVTRKLNNVAKTLAAGLAITLSLTAHGAEPSATASTVAWLGQMDVTAAAIHDVADLGRMEVTAPALRAVADLGSMTVTAVRETPQTSVAQRTKTLESSGEAGAVRTRSPRAVLVQ